MLRPRKPSAAFTLLELIVVLVVLAVLAAIAIPTFKAVIERSHDKTAEASLASYAREVQAVAAFRGDGQFTPADFASTAPDFAVAAGEGVSAALNVTVVPAPLNAKRFIPEQAALVSYGFAENDTLAGLAALSSSGNCVGVVFDTSSVQAIEMPADPSTCHGNAVLVRASNENAALLQGEDADLSSLGELKPPVPAVTAVTADGATVSWAPINGATGYRVELYSTSALTGGSKVYEGPLRSYTAEVGPDAAKFVVVTALQGTKASDRSSAVAIQAVPAAPANLQGTVTGSNVTLTWAAVPGADGYRLYRDGSDTVAAQKVGNTSTSATAPLVPGDSGTFVVLAYNEAGNSEASQNTYIAGVPVAPENVKATISGTTVTLTWNAVTGATGYYVYKNGDGEAHFVKVASGTTTTVTLTDGESASLQVRAYNDSGAGAASEAAAVTILPAAPQDVTKSVAGTAVTLSWKTVSGASGYEIFAGSSTTPATTTTTLSASVTLPQGETASYTVRARNASGLGAASVPVSATVVPAAPQDVTITAAGSTVTVSWTPSPGANGYYIYRDGTTDTHFVTSVVGGAKSSWTSGSLPAGTTAKYAVRAYNDGGASEASTEVAATVAPATPAAPTATLSGTTATLTWSAVSSAASYEVYRGEGTEPTATVSSLTTTVAISEGETTAFRIKAKNGAGTSEFSPYSNAVTAKPGQVQNLVAVSSLTDATSTLTWSAVPGATSYVVTWVNGSNSGDAGNVTSYTTGAHPAGQVHYYTVTAKNASGTGPVSAQVGTQATYAGTVSADAPIAQYRMADNGSTLANSAPTSTAKLGSGTYSGSYTVGQTSPLGSRDTGARSTLFTGGVVNLPSIPANTFDNGVSYETWVKFDASSGEYPAFVDLGSAAHSNNILFGRHAGTNQLYVHGFGGGTTSGAGTEYGRFITPTAPLKPGVWQHLAFTWAQNGDVVIYVDGAAVHSGKMLKNGVGAAPDSSARSSNFLGRNNWGAIPVKGNVAEAAIYNKALTAAQIQSHYNAGK